LERLGGIETGKDASPGQRPLRGDIIYDAGLGEKINV
jgi:hypothetical protein